MDTSSDTRSPSPVVPGAWPATVDPSPPMLHHILKSQDLPVSSAPPNPNLPLFHVCNIHPYRSLSISRIRDSSDTLAMTPSIIVDSSNFPDLSDFDSIPSERSDITSFMPHDTTVSLSNLTDASVDTAYTQHSVSGYSTMSKLPQELDAHMPFNSLQANDRVECLHTSYSCSRSTSNHITQGLIKATTCDPVTSSLSPSLHSQYSCAVPPESSTLSCAQTPLRLSRSNTTSPISPILFSSSTASNNASSAHSGSHSVSFEYSASSSWEASYRDNSNGEELHIGTPISLNLPRYSPRGPQIQLEDHIDIHNIPLLTSLSLPGSVNTIEHVLDDQGLRIIPQSVNSTLRTLLPTSPSLSTSSQISPTLFSPSPSSVSSLPDANLETRILTFPSPSLSLSPFTAAFPSSFQEDPSANDSETADISAVEYATAVMTSLWGTGDNTSIRTLDGIHANLEGIISVNRDVEPHNDAPLIGYPNNASTSRMINALKKCGRKIKIFIKEKTRRVKVAEISELNTAVNYVTNNDEALLSDDDVQDPPTAHRPNSQHGYYFVQNPMAAPPTLLHRPKKLRPHLTSQTYDPHPHSFYETPDGGNAVNHPSAFDCSMKTPESEIRPKTLAEVKSRRRFSLFDIPYFTRLANSSNSSLIAMAQTQKRPSSMLIPASRRKNPMMNEGTLQVRDTSNMASVVDFQVENNDREAAASLSPRSITQGLNTTTVPGSEVRHLRSTTFVKKGYRRLSLPVPSTKI